MKTLYFLRFNSFYFALYIYFRNCGKTFTVGRGGLETGGSVTVNTPFFFRLNKNLSGGVNYNVFIYRAVQV